MNNKYNVILLTVLSFLLAALGVPKSVAAESSDILSTLDSSHPRLMLKDEDLSRLKQQYESDQVLQKCVMDVLSKADTYCDKPMLEYQKIGPRLLHVSRSCLNRMYALGLAYRWTGSEKYAKKAVENLLVVCEFPDWNPSHFLDTAEMSHAVGIGYDWLFDYLDERQREQIRTALVKLGLEPGLQAYENSWWAESEHNWNQVCNGGLIVGALAIAESEPDYAQRIISAAIKSLPLALKSYSPDGAWPEGPAYWSYATHYTAYGLAALESALGTDFGLLKIEGFNKAGNFPIYTTGPTGMYLNFADSGEKASRRPMPCMFWLAQTFDNALFAEAEHAEIAKRQASPEHVIWYVPRPEKPSAKALDKYFRGPVEVATFRSAWDDPNALFVGVKAGYNQVNHGHLDLGNFELDALSVRWARDLGSDNYNLPGYWDMKRDGKRWTYYRLNSKSHSVPLLAGKGQDPLATSKFIKFQSKKSSAFVLIDLTSAYGEFAKKVMRGVAITADRDAVLVQDEFEIKESCEVVWAMTTDAEITIEKPDIARLNLQQKQLIARVLSPYGAEFAVESAEQQPPQKPNKGVKRLIVRLPPANGNVRVAVLLSPLWKDGRPAATVQQHGEYISSLQLQPLAEW
jgi:hypothetical protein